MLTWLGILSGLVGGMGMGGGAILVPGLVYLLGVEQHLAQGISLMTFLPMSAAALIVHWRAGNLKMTGVWPLILGSAAGAVGGSMAASSLPSEWMTRLFGLFLLAFGTYELLIRSAPESEGKKLN